MEATGRETPQAEVLALTETLLPAAWELQPQLLRFYGELIGLPRRPPEEELPGGIAFGRARSGVFLQYRHDPEVEPMRRRLTIMVQSLREVIERLTEHEWPFEAFHGLSESERWLTTADPNGHLLELREQRRVY